MTGMHADEITIDDGTVRRLVAAQFPDWASLPLRRLPPVGTDNQLFRLGDDLLVRTPRIHWAADSAVTEHAWLPRLAPHLPLPIPAPIALGEPGEGYPWHWTVVPWIVGETPTEQTFDPEEWAVSLAAFVRACREVPSLDGPVKTEGRGAPIEQLDDWVQEWTAKADPALVDRDAVLALWADALAAPAYDGEPRWFHGDLHEGNLLVRDGRLVAVIDWGAAGRGDPAIELNAMWGYLPASVAELYRAEVGLDEAAYRRARGFALAPSISALTYYRDTAPEIARGSLGTVERLLASLD
ncbi:Predicted kinase, aminoglycoside phosphotransferase (APT) family [Nocardioides exalbidus]|uniref:Predicted kinase, aminoglycoside phosphotransferase (APT) family n=1 Tax=Nocardioides exalbidus TaxID=402596 RepID=A0A1H4Z3N0_9ACTN|nr:aminoglycoside phosphotransferase family protein [Nocardioides exalbidus]SED24836.1 Predicted kinase, aminoglycoside phosphotransferase (APT) family [Nocardioides exalbidus]